MRFNKFLVLFTMATLGAPIACGGQTVTATKSASIVIDGAVAPITADPGHMRDVAGRTLMHAMYQTLLGFTGESVSEAQPIVASSYTLSADNKTLTLKLRSGLRFSDGSPLTADDVLFSLNRVKYLLGQPAFLLKGVAITSPDPTTIVLKSTIAQPELPFVMTDPALAILNSKVVKANGGLDTPDAATADHAQAYLEAHSAGSGPYTLTSFSTTAETVMAANPNFSGPGPKPNFSQVVYRLVQASAQQIEVQSGTAKVALGLSARDAAPLAGKFNVTSRPAGSTWFLLLNQNKAISSVTSNKNFVSAVRYGIDYSRILEVAGPGNEREASISPQTLAFALGMADAPKYDLAKAKDFLAQSGLSKPTVTFEYADPYGSSGVVYGQIAQAVQASLAKVGITVILKPTSVPVALANYLAGTEEFSLWSYSVSPPDPISGIARQFGPGDKFGLRAGWTATADPETVAIVSQIINSPAAERAGLFHKFYARLNESGPFVPLFAAANTVVSAKSVTNIVTNPQWMIDFAALKPAA